MKINLILFVSLSLTFSLMVSSNVFAKGESISLMSYNVENLFDDKNDKDKKDENFLPLKDKRVGDLCRNEKPSWRKRECERLNWDSRTLNEKMSQLAKVILSYGNGRGADIVVMPEVENLSVLNDFNKKYLGKAGYKTVELLEGPDVRGIDIAVLSRFEKKSPSKLHPVKWVRANPKPKRPTRSVLEVNLSLPGGKSATVFGVHFPSPSHMIEERMDAFDALLEAANKSKSELVVAAGDFNVTANEDSRLYRVYAGKSWDFSHHVGCGDCLGTNYYKPRRQGSRDSWSFLDAVAVLKTSKIKFVDDSIQVWNSVKDMKRKSNFGPNRFDPESGKGFSDHFPVVAKFK
jgi:endonuclease/exonuclease/phosphatase family metal-dependent hydrolase